MTIRCLLGEGAGRITSPGRRGGVSPALPWCLLAVGLLTACSAGCQLAGGGPSSSGVLRGQDAEDAPPDDPTRIEVGPQTKPKERLIDKLRFWDRFRFGKSTAAPPPTETIVFGENGPSVVEAPQEGTIQAELAGARELYRQGDYVAAEKVFAHMADSSRYPPNVVEEARFHEAECLRLQRKYPRAADTYADVLKKFPYSVYREQCLQHMYDIADYWLDDTRKEMEEYQQKLKGEGGMVWPRFFSTDKTKPFLDREGRALEKLEQVHYNDITGPLAAQSLFWIGSVKFYNENYRDADYYFSQLYERYPNSELAPRAVKLAIISKHLSTGGSDYDGRKSAEARKLVQAALTSYPELSRQRDFLMQQLVNINTQQAEKDFKMAEFYEWKGKPGSAFFMYEMVRRRYPGTQYAAEAADRIAKLRAANVEVGALPPEEAPPTGAGTQPELAPAPRPVGVAPQPELAPRPRPVP